MTSDLRARADALGRNVYPRPDPKTTQAINEKLVDVVSLLHSGRLSEAQLRELAASIRTQIENAEALHRFSLSNADEPAFGVRLHQSTRHG